MEAKNDQIDSPPGPIPWSGPSRWQIRSEPSGPPGPQPAGVASSQRVSKIADGTPTHPGMWYEEWDFGNQPVTDLAVHLIGCPCGQRKGSPLPTAANSQVTGYDRRQPSGAIPRLVPRFDGRAPEIGLRTPANPALNGTLPRVKFRLLLEVG